MSHFLNPEHLFTHNDLPLHCQLDDEKASCSVQGRSVVDELLGKTLSIPNLDPILAPVPAGRTEDFDSLKHRINSRLDEIVDDDVMRKKVDEIDLPLQMSRYGLFSII